MAVHIDGAYGGAVLAAPSVRHLYTGIERADSFIVDPHEMALRPLRLVRAALPGPDLGAPRTVSRRTISTPSTAMTTIQWT
ncbi:pyridoxal-dependent decarboxylase [Streptomyces europaeiscabiei]|uniref:pyridoxal-dependent decarboxylase n=1 Tax=Streptomyces europaeiscabiei TaxID=146819 RepID=UPI0038F77AF9